MSDKFAKLMNRVVKDDDGDRTGIVKEQPLREIKESTTDDNEMVDKSANSFSLNDAKNALTRDGEILNHTFTPIREMIFTTESETNFNNDINIEDIEGGENDYENYTSLCNNCMIESIVGCKGCGIYQYTIIRNEYEITVRRRCNDGVDTK